MTAIRTIETGTEFLIERGARMPRSAQAGKRRYPFNQMEIGDSFAFPLADRHKLASAASLYGQRTSRKFSIRKTGNCCRVWRTA